MSKPTKQASVKPKNLRPGRGGGPVVMVAEKPKHFRSSLKKLLQALAPYQFTIIVAIILTIISTLLLVMGPRLLGNMTNSLVDSLGQNQALNYEFLGSTALLLLTLYLLSTLTDITEGWLLAGVTQKLTLKLRRDLAAKINRLPISYFDTHPFGDTLSRLTNDVDAIGQTLNQSLANILSSLTSVIGILVFMFFISWQMTLVTLVTLPLSLLCVSFIAGKSQKYFKTQQDELGKLDGLVEEMYAGHLVVKLSAAEKIAEKQFAAINHRLYTNSWRAQFLSGMMMPLMQVIGNIGYVGVVIVGSWGALNGLVNLGDIQAFIQYVHRFNQPLSQVAQMMTVLQSTLAAAERVFEFLEAKEEIPDPATPAALPCTRGMVEFSHVHFGYSPEQEVIKDFSAKIKPGQKVAIVGPTGAGKTTIVNLLMRFYDPRAGKIFIDGIDTQTLSRHQVRAQFGMVLQDTWLFHGTVRENLAYGKLTVNDKDLQTAAHAASVAHFIASLPQGYATPLGEDAESISTGERQLLTIARAMVANAPMLILDEATSSVDTRTEILIQKAMKKLTQGRTSFIIAHRLSTIRDADLILVLSEGNIVEQGTHESLLALGGFYANIYQSQFSQ